METIVKEVPIDNTEELFKLKNKISRLEMENEKYKKNAEDWKNDLKKKKKKLL